MDKLAAAEKLAAERTARVRSLEMLMGEKEQGGGRGDATWRWGNVGAAETSSPKAESKPVLATRLSVVYSGGSPDRANPASFARMASPPAGAGKGGAQGSRGGYATPQRGAQTCEGLCGGSGISEARSRDEPRWNGGGRMASARESSGGWRGRGAESPASVLVAMSEAHSVASFGAKSTPGKWSATRGRGEGGTQSSGRKLQGRWSHRDSPGGADTGQGGERGASPSWERSASDVEDRMSGGWYETRIKR